MGIPFPATPLAKLAMRAACAALLAMPLSGLAARDAAADPVVNRSIGYVVTDLFWSLYQTKDGKAECPEGPNEIGPREMFKQVFPDNGTKRSVLETQLNWEGAIWTPGSKEDHSPYHEAKGPVGLGMNLDGKVGPNDFTSPDGVKGIDNQLYRAIGCSRFFRGPDGTFYIFGAKYVRDFAFNRVLIELTNVDDLTNDKSVDVAIYRGLNRLMNDSSGDKVMPGGTERVDARFGKHFEAHLKGKIENGVLTTEPQDIYLAWSCFPGVPGGHHIRGMRFDLKLTPTSASGMMGGYADVDEWYTHLIGCQSTHHLSYGQLYAPPLYTALHRLADGYPDKDGAMTAISSAIDVSMAQVYVVHDAPQTASSGPKGDARQAARR